MQLKHVLAALPLFALTGTAQADFNSNNHLLAAGVTYVQQNECGELRLTVQSLDLTTKVGTTGSTRTSNDYGYTSQSLRVEGLQVDLMGVEPVDGACVDVWDSGILQGVDATTTLLDGTTVENLMCADETGIDFEHSCHVQGVTTAHNRATFAGTVALYPTGRVVDMNLRLEATDVEVVLAVKINPALFSLRIDSNIPGQEEQTRAKTHTDLIEDWRYMLQQNSVLSDVYGSVKIDGQEFVPSDTVNASQYGSTSAISRLKMMSSSASVPMTLL